MLNPLSVMAAHDRSREMQSWAAQRRLARLARCCRPSYLAKRLSSMRERLAARRGRAVCCA
jgi:hypothetical protein